MTGHHDDPHACSAACGCEAADSDAAAEQAAWEERDEREQRAAEAAEGEREAA